MSTYMIRDKHGKLLPRTATSDRNETILSFTVYKPWKELEAAGYEVVRVVGSDTADELLKICNMLLQRHTDTAAPALLEVIDTEYDELSKEVITMGDGIEYVHIPYIAFAQWDMRRRATITAAKRRAFVPAALEEKLNQAVVCATCGELVPEGCCTCGPRQRLEGDAP